MRVGFFHDAPLLEHGGQYYSIGFGQDVWRRYLRVFEQMLVCTRVVRADRTGTRISSTPGVEFRPIDAYGKPRDLLTRTKPILQQIDDRLKDVDCAIVRLPSVIGWLACRQAYRVGKPVLIELVGCPWDAYRMHGTIGRAIAPFAYLVTRTAVRRAGFVVYVTRDFLQGRYPTNGRSAAISNVEITSSEDKLQRRLSKIETPQLPIVLGSIGKVDLKYKGHKTGIAALASLRRQGYDIEYEIAGPGDPDTLLKQATALGIEDKARFKGALTASEITDWLASIDIYIHPSLSEGLPRAAIEAIAQGVPAILSEVGGHRELLEPSHLFPSGNTQALASRIEEMINSDWSTLAKRNFAKALEYDQPRLESKRDHILAKFRESVAGRTHRHNHSQSEGEP